METNMYTLQSIIGEVFETIDKAIQYVLDNGLDPSTELYQGGNSIGAVYDYMVE